MNHVALLHFAHEAAASALVWSCFCRLVRTDENTIVEIRFGFWLLNVAALVDVIAPYYGWATPNWPGVLMTAAITVMQVFTARFWRADVPSAYTRYQDEHREAA